MGTKTINLSDPNTSFWINASAGTGKTSILVKRVLGLLVQNIEPSRILCITFTKAAALEMKKRVADELAKWTFLDDKLLEKSLQSLLNYTPTTKQIFLARTLFAKTLEEENSPQIQTIHSFCHFILKKFSFETDLAPNFKILDDNDIIEIFEDAKSSIYKIIEFRKDLRESLDTITTYSSEFSLSNFLFEVMKENAKLTKILEEFSAESILENLLKKFDITILSSKFYEEEILKSYFNYNLLLAKLDLSDTNLELNLKTAIYDFIDNKHITNCKNIFLTKDGSMRKKLFSNKFIQGNEELVNEFIKEQERIYNLFEKIQIVKIVLMTKAALIFAAEFTKIFAKKKQEKASIDYSDIITLTIKLLQDNEFKDWILFKLDQHIDHILVDEAQDTNYEQWELISCLSNDFFSGEGAKDLPRSIFVVGDEKQSIYSFQGANYQYFHIMKKIYEKIITQSGRNFEELTLEVSYRSASSILKFTDYIFNKNDLKSRITINSNDIKHQCNRIDEFGKVEILPLIQDKELSDKNLAVQIASKIKELFDHNLIIKNRTIMPKDIMILVRRRSNLIPKIIKELNELKIPVTGLDRFSLFDEIAIEDLISAANFALYPNDDLNLASLLKSPIIGTGEELLEKICVTRTTTIWDNISKNSDYILIKSVLDELIKMRNYNPYDFFSEILYRLGFIRKFVQTRGIEVKAIINEFLAQVIKFSESHNQTIQGFIKWICSTNCEIKKNHSSDENKIRILTIHSAKGLQAPIVIIPDTTTIPKEKNSDLVISDHIVIWKTSIKNQNKFLQEISLKEQENIYNEYIRLLYVALTRAENYLIIAGSISQKNLDPKSWYSILNQSMKELNSEFLINNLPKYKNIFKQTEIVKTLPADYFYQKPAHINNDIINFSAASKVSKYYIKFSPYEINPMESNRIKGILIHKILEIICKIDDKKRADFIDFYLKSQKLDKKIIEKIKTDCIKVLENYPNLFTKDALNELKIGGKINIDNQDLIFLGQVDKIITKNNEIAIIDFKSTANMSVDFKYLFQLNCYKAIIKEIMNKDKISSSILWTINAELENITEYKEKILNEERS